MIIPIGQKHIKDIVGIHVQALKGDFLPSLGSDFLQTFYQGLVGKPGIFGFVNLEKKQLTGFIIGTNDMDNFFKTAIKGNFLKLSWLLGLKILQQPQLLGKIVETFLYPQKDRGVKAELVIIAILKSWQGKGLGKKLILSLENKFRQEKIRKYKLTVYQNKKAISFYQTLKFVKVSNFNLYGKPWSIYEKKIN